MSPSFARYIPKEDMWVSLVFSSPDSLFNHSYFYHRCIVWYLYEYLKQFNENKIDKNNTSPDLPVW